MRYRLEIKGTQYKISHFLANVTTWLRANPQDDLQLGPDGRLKGVTWTSWGATVEFDSDRLHEMHPLETAATRAGLPVRLEQIEHIDPGRVLVTLTSSDEKRVRYRELAVPAEFSSFKSHEQEAFLAQWARTQPGGISLAVGAWSFLTPSQWRAFDSHEMSYPPSSEARHDAHGKLVLRHPNAKKDFDESDIGKMVEIDYFTVLRDRVPQTGGYKTVRGVLTAVENYWSCQTIYIDGQKVGVFHPMADAAMRVIEEGNGVPVVAPRESAARCAPAP